MAETTKTKINPFESIIDKRVPDKKAKIFQVITELTGIPYKALQDVYSGRLINPRIDFVVPVTEAINAAYKSDTFTPIDYKEWLISADKMEAGKQKIAKKFQKAH